MTTTLSELRQLVCEHFGVPPDKVADAVPFSELGLDSLSVVDFMFTVEDRYHIDIDHQAAMANPTLAGLAAVVDVQLAKNPGPAA